MVFIVEDNASLLDTLCSSLVSIQDCDAHGFLSGELALDAIGAGLVPDVVIADHVLEGGMDGLDLLLQIRSTLDHSRLVLVSGVVSSLEQEQLDNAASARIDVVDKDDAAYVCAKTVSDELGIDYSPSSRPAPYRGTASRKQGSAARDLGNKRFGDAFMQQAHEIELVHQAQQASAYRRVAARLVQILEKLGSGKTPPTVSVSGSTMSPRDLRRHVIAGDEIGQDWVESYLEVQAERKRRTGRRTTE